MENTGRRELIRILLEYICVIIIYVVSYFISKSQYAITGFFMIGAGIGGYLYFALKGERSFLNMKGVFTIAWVSTIGLAQFMLNAYQEPWESFTWVCVCSAHVAFLIANDFAHRLFPALEQKFNLNKLNNSKFPFRYQRKDSRLFWIALITACIGIVLFIINVVIKGYIPLTAIKDNHQAYVEFYTRLHIFVVASMVSGGLAYYCLKKCVLSATKKVVCVFIIVILVFIIPILLVQRGTFIIMALILTTVIFLANKKRRFILLLACLIVMVGIYQLGTGLRGYSDDDLKYTYQVEREEIEQQVQTTGQEDETTQDQAQPIEAQEEGGSIDAQEQPAQEPQTENLKEKDNAEMGTEKPAEIIEIELSPKQAYLFGYLSLSHDNFNCAVREKTENTWGVLQLIPFNVILRNDALTQALGNVELHLVHPDLNTNNLIGFAYYDFGIIGVVIMMLIWSFGFGIVEAFERKYKGPFISLIYGVCLIPVALCFFNAWMSYFTTWLLWGTVLIMFAIASFTGKKSKKQMMVR